MGRNANHRWVWPAIGAALLAGCLPPGGEKETPAVSATAAEISAAWHRNVVAAQAAYSGKPVVVTGPVAEIGITASHPYLGLGSGPDDGVLVQFAIGDDSVARLRRGDTVAVRCEHLSAVVELAVFFDCEMDPGPSPG